MYEQRQHRLISRADFAKRVAGHFLFSLGVIALALGIGVVGYHVIAGLGWIDSILNASMILGGMGPVDRLDTPGAKLFASGYALFSGIIFIALAGVIIAPFLHRLIHRFHLQDDES